MEFIHVKYYKSEFIRKEEDDKLILQPVVKDFEGNFHFAPFLNNYVQINYITQKLVPWPSLPRNKGFLVESELVVFDRYYYRKRKEIVTYMENSHFHPSSLLTPSDAFRGFNNETFEDKINLINKYVDLGGDIFKIHFERFSHFTQTINDPINNLLSIVSNLQFTYYENGRVQAKKDDSLWVEVEIRNLPKNDKYIIGLIENIVYKIGYSYSIEDYGILMILNDEGTENNKWPYERKLCKKEFNIRDRILAELIKAYDTIEHSFEYLTLEEKIWS